MSIDSDRNNYLREGLVTSDVNVYEDDGFFSDVPATGSISKSQRALNKYLKTNLLYENGEDDESDRAYFSKESSPNESVSKCDSESVQSNESFEKKVSPLSGDKSDVTNSTSKDSIVRDSDVVETKESSNVSKIPPAMSTNHSEKPIYDSSDNSIMVPTRDQPITEPKAVPQEKKHPVRNSKNFLLETKTNEQTEEPKVILRKKPHNERIVPNRHSTTNLIASSNNYSQNNETTKKTSQENNQIKKPAENRHTMHDLSEWVNRTTVYPDVYAPLPYSK